MADPVINFTVSMWNRLPHLVKLLDDLCEVAKVDPNIALHVCAFEGEDASLSELRRVVDSAPCPSVLNYRTDKFGNGLGHNLVSGGVERDQIVCNITVDICLPPDITQRIRPLTQARDAIYYPVMFQQCRDGTLAGKGGGGALIALYKCDWYRTGGLYPQRSPWGGNDALDGAEDINFLEQAKTLGYRINRPVEKDMFCRWHKRPVANPFYRTMRKRRYSSGVPWINLFDANGKEIK